MKTQHTPTPLKIRPARFNGIEKYIVEMVYEDRRDAEAHVRAVNAHEELVTTLKEILAEASKPDVLMEIIIGAARQAISKAEGKS